MKSVLVALICLAGLLVLGTIICVIAAVMALNQKLPPLPFYEGQPGPRKGMEGPMSGRRPPPPGQDKAL